MYKSGGVSKMDKFAFVFSGIASLATFLFGGWDLSLQIFLAFMIIDFITGLLHGFYNGELSSKVGYRGIIKKTGMLIVLIIANLLDALTGAPMFRIAVCYFFIATEGISIL